MSGDGETKDDVKNPGGEIGEKLQRLFEVEEKETSESPSASFGSRARDR